MRLSLGAVLVLASLALAACPSQEPLGTSCAVSADCPRGQLCVDEVCVEDPGSLPVGEGEGNPAEGEGDPAEGEGDPAEGEGDPAEGEGEGGPAEGEGEGGPAEGEGEGAPAPVCAPSCGDLQSCTADDVCSNDAGTSLCDTFGATTIDFFADQNLTLNGSSGERYSYDTKDRYYLNRLFDVRQGMLVEVTVIADYDTVAYVLNDSTQQCTQLARVDASYDDEVFRIDFGAGLTPPYSGSDGTPLDVAVTSFAALGSTGTTTGAFTLQTRGILCTAGNAMNDVTDNQTTYDQCFRALWERSGLSCEASNPCARDASGNTTGKWCGLQANVHTPGSPIALGDDAFGGPCCGSSAGCPGAGCPANCL